MSDERWQRVEDLFHEAADLPAAERSAFLSRETAGDDELRRDVESLLAHDSANETVLSDAVGRAIEKLPDASGSGEEFIGKQIRDYRITELIGKGGMGIVFKAHDNRLNRSVAIKALVRGCFDDSERKRRFLQEAKAASALNHPNIVTIHDIAEEDGTDFLIMEYVSGKTLDRLIPRHGLPLKQALKYAIEIGDALAAAHAAGIVHRDIKPSNVMLAGQERVKILDFGLAKHAKPIHASGSSTLSIAPGSEPGMVVGTADYMSPEQAEGKPVDARSDIFSFGALLYEMITGRRAFPGQNVITILSAVINQDPPPMRTFAANVPPELEKIVSRCLKKDPARRIQVMLDVKLALEEVVEGIGSPPDAPIPARPRLSAWLAPVFVVLLGLVLGVWLGERILRKEPVTWDRLTFRQGDVDSARFAPGGSVVYAAGWDSTHKTLFSGQPGNREARDLGLPAEEVFSISHSGEMLIRLSTRSTLAQVPLAGGVPRELLEHVSGADWGPDGKSFAVVRTIGGRQRVEYPSGVVLYEAVMRRPPERARVSPGGDLVALFALSDVGDYSIAVVGSKHPWRILSKGWRTIAGLSWSPAGREIWFSGGRTGGAPGLYTVDLSGRERLVAQVPGYGMLYDIANDGRLLLSVVDSRLGIRCLAPGSSAERDLGWFDASRVNAMSDDGKWILFSELSSGEGRNPAIFLRRTDGSPAVRLGYGNSPDLSPDGKSVLCIRSEDNEKQLVLLPTGAGEARTLPGGGIRPLYAEWFPDGNRILVTGNESSQPSQPPRTYLEDLATGNTRPVTAPGVSASGISPDGKLVVVIASRKVYLHSIETGTETAVAALDADATVARWSGDGRYIFLNRSNRERETMTILRLDVHTGRAEVWRELKPPDPLASFFNFPGLSADGKSYAFSFQRNLATLYLVNGVN